MYTHLDTRPLAPATGQNFSIELLTHPTDQSVSITSDRHLIGTSECLDASVAMVNYYHFAIANNLLLNFPYKADQVIGYEIHDDTGMVFSCSNTDSFSLNWHYPLFLQKEDQKYFRLTFDSLRYYFEDNIKAIRAKPVQMKRFLTALFGLFRHCSTSNYNYSEQLSPHFNSLNMTTILDQYDQLNRQIPVDRQFRAGIVFKEVQHGC